MSADDDYFAGELGRRTIEISGVREDLEDAQARVREAEDRTESLHQAIAKLHRELAFRQIKASELEDLVVAGHVQGETQERQLESARVATVAEVAQLQQCLSQGENTLYLVREGAEAARLNLNRLQTEILGVRARLEVLRLDAEQAQKDLLRELSIEDDRQARLVGEAKQRAAHCVDEARAAMDALAADELGQRQEVAKLRMGLELEKECNAGLKTALQHTEQKSDLVTKECVALRRELEALKYKVSAGSVREALAAARKSCQELTKEVASSKHAAMMQAQSIEGALEETQRILVDQEEDRRKLLEESQRFQIASPLADLATALAGARQATAMTASLSQRAQAECNDLQFEVDQARSTVAKAEQQCLGRDQVADAEAAVAWARRELETGSQAASAALQEEACANGAVKEAERDMAAYEDVLRSRLEELWRALRKVRSGSPAYR